MAEVFITDQLLKRTSIAPDHRQESLAIQELAGLMQGEAADVLPRLVGLALDICGAESAGVSVLDTENRIFRWSGLAGRLTTFEGATTPRDYSPCGICLDQEKPILMARPERVYTWIREAGITVPEVLLVPLSTGGQQLGTLWVVAPESAYFEAEHARVLSEVGSFASVVLRTIQTEEKLTKALAEQQTLAHEMSHRLKNVFAIIGGLIHRSERQAKTKEELAEAITGRLHALAEAQELVFGGASRRSQEHGVLLVEVLNRVLKPYGEAFQAQGPEIQLGEQATTSLALIFHELATNAAKHGAFSKETGRVAVDWRRGEGNLLIRWDETGGPQTSVPKAHGFGSTLVKAALSRHGGTIDYAWNKLGLDAIISLPEDRLLA